MTLGCGALGGNITSDNIGPQHLMNLRRVAWESRPVEHRTISAANRMNAPAAIAAAAASASVTGATVKPTNPQSQSSPAPIASGVPDRAAIAHAVEHVMAHLGIARGAVASGAAKSAASAANTASSAAKPVATATNVSPFVTEGDVRRAVTRGEKIFIGPKTILTPSARDVAGSENVIVLTDYVPPAPAATSSE